MENKLKCELYNDSMQEEWRSIKGYEGLYEISSLGRVRSLERIITVERNGKKYPKKLNGFILKPWLGVDYLHVTLSNNGKVFAPFIHKLVAEAFIENPMNYPHVNHKDENKNNNVWTNLEWCTQTYNRNYGTGEKRRLESFTKSVESHKRKRKSVLQYDKKGNFIKRYFSISVTSKYGFSSGNVCRCCKGQLKSYKGYVWKYET